MLLALQNPLRRSIIVAAFCLCSILNYVSLLTMKVILLKEVARVGKKGDVKDIEAGIDKQMGKAIEVLKTIK